MNIKQLAGAVATLALAGAAQAAVVTYQESVSGDLGSGLTLTTFSFGVGVNTVSGNTGYSFSTDLDSFAFIVPVGAELVAAQIQLTDTVGDLIGALWLFNSGSLSGFGGSLLEQISAPSPGTLVFTKPPLGAGDYNMTAASLSGTGLSNFADYTFSFTLRSVNQVPEPSTILLIGVAALAGATARRRRNG